MPEFFKAVKEGDISKVKHMIDMDQTLVKAENGNGLSAVITAAYFGNNEIAELLNTAVYTSLHAAAQTGNVEIAKLLLSHGANVNDRKDDGKTPLAITREEGPEAGSKEGRRKTAELLLQHGATTSQPSDRFSA
jgi:ankyrin repeat protein